MRAVLQRDRSLTAKAVFGKLSLSWMPSASAIFTGEPLSCIPAGIYSLIGHQGPQKFNVWELANIPGHTGILIHEGNFPVTTTWNGSVHEAESHNCILVGFGVLTSTPMLVRSDAALDYLRSIFGTKPAGELMNIELEIRE